MSSWQEVKEAHADEVEGGRRNYQRIQEKEGMSAIIKLYKIDFKTPYKTKTFSAEEVLQEMNEASQKEIRDN